MTKHPIIDSRHWQNQKLCFDNVIFSLPPRASFW
jgi:hypothetical protein